MGKAPVEERHRATALFPRGHARIYDAASGCPGKIQNEGKEAKERNQENTREKHPSCRKMPLGIMVLLAPSSIPGPSLQAEGPRSLGSRGRHVLKNDCTFFQGPMFLVPP